MPAMEQAYPVTFTDQADGVRLVEVDNPPVNALSAAVRAGLLQAVQGAQSAASVRAIVLACRGRTFIAGADIREFGQPAVPPTLPDVVAAIESSAKPVVAAIHGSALGGGLEVALACHARIATPDASLGLPEVNLGLMPGAGGTQRLPRLVGLRAGLDMILSGQPVKAPVALEMGLLDAVAPGSLAGDAIALGLALAQRGGWRRSGELPFPADPGVDFAAEARRVGQRQRGQPAPLAILRVLEASPGLSLPDGLQLEREAFLALRATPESAALRYVFFAERTRTGAGKGEGRPGGAGVLERTAVIGAGTMGQGIAIALAGAGLSVTLVEPEEAARQRARTALDRHFASQARRDPAAAVRHAEVAARIQLGTELADAVAAQLVVEAVFEDLEVKRGVFRALEAIVQPDTVLASNTSYLDLDAIAAVLQRPGKFLGLHFFSPANVMKLLEVVRASATSADTQAFGLALGRRLGKVPVPMGNCHGFTGNRMLAKRTREAYFLLEEGALPWDVDRVLQSFGFAMGPFRVGDLAGLDIGWRNRQSRLASLTPRERSCSILDQMVDRGWLGQKAGRGYYLYDEARNATPDPEVERLIVEHSARQGIERRAVSDQEILERCLYPMVNEAALVIDEGIVERPEDVDLVWLHGYGFPRHRGGPLHWADAVGLPSIVAAMDAYAGVLGEAFWQAAPGLRDRARRGVGFIAGRGA
jgi:3-hydroxyacyl-CoA dehydrogenase